MKFISISESGGFIRILISGSWYHSAKGCGSAHRDGVDPYSTDKDFGFRIVLAPDYTDK